MARVAFRQADVERLLRAARAVGYSNPVVEKRTDGSLRLLTDAPPADAVTESGAGDDLDAELEAFARKHGYG